MDAERRLRPLLRRLDADLARAFAESEPVVLAFSGGLASLVLAALARKRGRVECVVVGTRGAADVEAALVAKSFLDYPVEVVRPSHRQILEAARAIRAVDARLDPAEVVSLVPLSLVLERHPEEPVVCGFGLSPRSSAVQRYLDAVRVYVPAVRRSSVRSPPRRTVAELAWALAIPDGFVLAARRTPAEGSGAGPALRAMGHARHASVARLLEGLV